MTQASNANRKARRSLKRASLAGITAATATALAMGVAAPGAEAASPSGSGWAPYECSGEGGLCAPVTTLSSGPLMALLTPIINLISPDQPLLTIGPLISTGLKLIGTSFSAQQVYDTLNTLPYGKPSLPGTNFTACRGMSQDLCRPAFVLTTGIGALNVAEAVNRLQSSSQNNVVPGTPLLPPGSTPFGPVTNTATGLTAVSGIYLLNAIRPNGGLATRFAPLFNLFGKDTTMPIPGVTGATAAGASVYNAITDLTWQYNPMADLPVTANPFALLNSIYATVPPPQVVDLAKTIVGGGSISAAFSGLLEGLAGTVYSPTGQISSSSADQCNNPGANCQTNFDQNVQLSLLSNLSLNTVPSNANGIYGTMYANQGELPILYPMHILSALVNPILEKLNSKYLLGAPLADLLRPAMKILVNSSYTDVVTPDELNQVDPSTPFGQTFAEEGYQAWDRTFYKPLPQDPVPFMSVNPLTPEQQAKLPGQVWDALTAAFEVQKEKPFFGFLVPNTPPPTASVKATATTAAPAAAESATPVEAPLVAPVAEPVVPASAPTTPDPVPAAAPVTRISGLDKLTGGRSATDTTSAASSHRGPRHSDQSADNAGGFGRTAPAAAASIRPKVPTRG